MKDLLPRRMIVRDRSPVAKMLNGSSIVVTGAGGSIGSELVRQISNFGVNTQITLIDNCEFNAYRIGREFPYAKVYLADVRDDRRISEVLAKAKPNIIFHAAALKHVPLVEENPIEAIKTNILGTANIVRIGGALNAKVVMISTDKAVRPKSVMGATKRIAEMYCELGRNIVVRFGNVLGSSGSVVPLFQEQIKAGGPVTITHPDMQRYFMSIDEAVELVLHAATGEPAVYVLDMGQAVKIMDLAWDMIRLSGKMPGQEIKIETVGTRAGERLNEELFYSDENVRPSGIDGVMIAKTEPDRKVGAAVEEIRFYVEKNKEKAIALMWELANGKA